MSHCTPTSRDNSQASTPPGSRMYRRYFWLPPPGVAITRRVGGESKQLSAIEQPDQASAVDTGERFCAVAAEQVERPPAQPLAQLAQPSSRNRPQSSMKRSHRVGGMSHGVRAGSSRASASAQALGAPPSYSITLARSSKEVCQSSVDSQSLPPQNRDDVTLVEGQEVEHGRRRCG